MAHCDPRPLKSTGRHGHFLNSICDIELIDVRHGFQKDNGNKRWHVTPGHVTDTFPKFDIWHGHK